MGSAFDFPEELTTSVKLSVEGAVAVQEYAAEVSSTSVAVDLCCQLLL